MLSRKIKGPILVTGHTGFKGTWLTLFLRQLGYDVIGYSLKPDSNSLYTLCNLKGAIPEVFGDINEHTNLSKFLKIHKPEVIFHLAANALVLNSYNSPFEYFRTNTLGTASILDVASKFKFVRVIGVVTTDKVYGSGLGNFSFSEDDRLVGFDPYSESKVGAEAAVRAWRNINSLSNGAKILALRSGNVIGGGDLSENRLIPDLIRGYKDSTTVSIRNKNNTRPWMHVLDTIFGYYLAVINFESHLATFEFNFAPRDSSLKVIEIVKIAESMLTPLRILYRKDDIFRESINLNLDATKANKVLGWHPIFNQENAVRDTLEWWLQIYLHNISPLQICNESIEKYINRVGLNTVKN